MQLRGSATTTDNLLWRTNAPAVLYLNNYPWVVPIPSNPPFGFLCAPLKIAGAEHSGSWGLGSKQSSSLC